MRCCARSFQQQGLASLLITVVLVLAATLLALTLNRTTIAEYVMLRNQKAQQQAFANAMSALETLKANYANSMANTTFDAAKMKAAVCPSVAAITGWPTSATALCGSSGSAADIIVAVGLSDDETAIERVTERLLGTNPTQGGRQFPAPLLTGGAANIGGSATVLNYFNDFTIWAGGNLSAQNATINTLIRNTATDHNPTPQTRDYRATNVGPNCNNVPAGYTCSTNMGNNNSIIGLDIIDNDPTLLSLSGLTSDVFLQASLGTGMSRQAFVNYYAGWTVDLRGDFETTYGHPPSSTSFDSVMNNGTPRARVVYVHGDLDISGNTTYGSASAPILLVVDGNAKIKGAFYGSIIAMGNFSTTGNTTIYGAVFAKNAGGGTGNATIVYDPYPNLNYQPFAGAGKPQAIPGSWKDW